MCLLLDNHTGKVRNRTNGIRPPNSTEASHNNSENVKVQDETNIPKADWEDELHHDKVNDTEIHEECPFDMGLTTYPGPSVRTESKLTHLCTSNLLYVLL